MIAEPLHDPLARRDHRDRHGQRQPKPAPEHLRIMTGVLVVPRVGTVLGMTAVQPLIDAM